MAEAFIRTVEKLVPQEVRDGITLILSDQEAHTLRLILCRVGGDPKTSARRYADQISNALKILPPYEWRGVEYERSLTEESSIRFTEASMDYLREVAPE